MSEPPNGSRYRWVICGLLFFATTINYMDRQILSLLKPMLDVQLGWTSTQFGLINSAFQAAYGLSLLGFGWFIDRFGTKIGYAVSIAAWSLAALAHALVGLHLGFFRACGSRSAWAKAAITPRPSRRVAQWFPPQERALAASIVNSGANRGAILAPLLVPVIAYSLGWHWAFVFAGIAGFTWLTLWWPLFDLPERSARVSPAELAFINSGPTAGAADARPATWREILRHREAWSFVAAKFITDPIWWFFLIWLPDFFKQTRHLDIKNSWPLLTSIYGIITVLSIVGGWMTGWLTARGWSITRARKAGMLVFALCVVPVGVVTHVGNWMAVALIGLAGAAHQAWSSTIYTTVSDMFPKPAIAKVIGLGSMAGSLGGLIFPTLTGILLDRAANGYAIIFGFCSGAYLLALIINHWLAPQFKPVSL